MVHTYVFRRTQVVEGPAGVELKRHDHVYDQGDGEVASGESSQGVVDGRGPLPPIEQTVLA